MSAEFSSSRLTRRRLLALASAGAASSLVAGCASPGATPPPPQSYTPPEPRSPETPAAMYAAVLDGGFPIPAVPYEKIDPRLYRQMVFNPTGEAPGTVVVDTDNHFLYYTMPGGQAMRYGVGLGRAGFEWSGRGVIEWKQEWPRWFPPDEMIDRQPELEKYRAS